MNKSGKDKMSDRKVFPIKFTYDTENSWFNTAASNAYSGQIIFEDNKIQIKLGPYFYDIEKITKISTVQLSTFELFNWIKIEYTTEGKDYTVQILSNKWNGFLRLFTYSGIHKEIVEHLNIHKKLIT